MAKNHSRRLHKEVHIEELQEVRFSIVWRFSEGTSGEQADQIVDDSTNEVIEPDKLAFDGGGYLVWEGLTCLQEIGRCTEGHQAIVHKWLEEYKLEEVRTSGLFNIRWDQATQGRQAPTRFVLRERYGA